MKDKIFLIWSGNNIIAQKVKTILETEHSYICIVGGSFEAGGQMLTVGDTVIKQMKGCNQAIIIFQNKDNNTISNNLYFELGFVASSYGLKKIHCVKRKTDNITLPSDFDNSFVKAVFELKTFVIEGELVPPDRLGFTDPALLSAVDYITASSIEKLYSFTLKAESLSSLIDLADRERKAIVDRPLKSLDMLEVLS